MDPLASVEELVLLALHAQGVVLDEDYAGLVLSFASGTVRAETGQDFTAVTDDELVLDGIGEAWLTLPQRPVTAVSSVSVNGTELAATEWTLSGNRLYRHGGWNRAYVSGNSSWPGRAPTVLTVVYDHGYAVVPDDVRAATLMVAAEMVANPQGLTAEDIDDYRWRRSDSAPSPAADALATLVRRYNPRARSVRLAR